MPEFASVSINGVDAPGLAAALNDKMRERRAERVSGDVDAGHLRAFIERVERLEEEKRAIADDIKAVYAEAKGTGYDPAVMRKIVSLRRMDRSKRNEAEEMLSLYLEALGEE